jgi:hypothetical protein
MTGVRRYWDDRDELGDGGVQRCRDDGDGQYNREYIFR